MQAVIFNTNPPEPVIQQHSSNHHRNNNNINNFKPTSESGISRSSGDGAARKGQSWIVDVDEKKARKKKKKKKKKGTRIPLCPASTQCGWLQFQAHRAPIHKRTKNRDQGHREASIEFWRSRHTPFARFRCWRPPCPRNHPRLDRHARPITATPWQCVWVTARPAIDIRANAIVSTSHNIRKKKKKNCSRSPPAPSLTPTTHRPALYHGPASDAFATTTWRVANSESEALAAVFRWAN